MTQNFEVYAVGDFGPRDDWNPPHVISSMKVWPMLQLLKQGPSSVSILAEQCGLAIVDAQLALEKLTRLGVVRRLGGHYILGFAWFSAVDQDAVNGAVFPLAVDLADRICSRRAEIDASVDALRSRRWSDPRDLRYALVGCFGFDWGGLQALNASGHLVHDKAQPGDRRYVLYVQDKVDRFNHKDYAGSHSTSLDDGFTWTSFGDHSGNRFGLPDLLWHLCGTVSKAGTIPAPLRPSAANLVLEGLHLHLRAAAEGLVGLAHGEPPKGIGLTVLEAVSAIREGQPAVPIFFQKEDGRAMGVIVDITKDSLRSVIEESYSSLERALADLGALRNGVAFGECFNAIWHTLSGHTNRVLAEQGFLADPEPCHPGEGRYHLWLTA